MARRFKCFSDAGMNLYPFVKASSDNFFSCEGVRQARFLADPPKVRGFLLLIDNTSVLYTAAMLTMQPHMF